MKQAQIYSTLLTRPGLPETLQRRIFAFGKANKNYDLLITLANYADLASSVDASLRTVSQAKVRIAWLTRPGRTPSEIAKATTGEKRVSTLTSVLQSGTLAPNLAQSIAAAAAERNSAALALTVLTTQPSITSEVAADLVRICVTGLGADAVLRPLVKRYLTSHKQYLETALWATTSIAEVETMVDLCTTIAPPLQLHIIDNLLIPHVKTQKALPLAQALEKLDNLSEEAIQRLLHACSMHPNPQPGRAYYGQHHNWDALRLRLTDGSDFKQHRQSNLDLAATTADTAEFTHLTTLAAQFSDNQLLQTLVCNQVVDISTVTSLIQSNYRARTYADNAIMQATDPMRAARLIVASGSWHRTAKHPLQSEIIDTMIEALSDSQTWLTPNDLRHFAINDLLTVEQIRALPLSCVDANLPSVLELAVAELGNNPAQWELFEALLVDGSAMSLGFAIELAKTSV